jgi:hypothetical protein
MVQAPEGGVTMVVIRSMPCVLEDSSAGLEKGA